METYLQQQVTQLLAEGVGVLMVDCVYYLVGFFYKVAADGFVGLLRVPGTAAGGSQAAQYVYKRQMYIRPSVSPRVRFSCAEAGGTMQQVAAK